MESLIFSTGIALIFIAIIVILKYFFPRMSYEMGTSLMLLEVACLIFSAYFIILVINSSWGAIWPFAYLLLTCNYIYQGAKSIALKTTTAVFSKVTKEMIGRIGPGIHWIDPLFEVATTSVDGIPNKTIDLQQLKMQVVETPEMHTATRGITARVKNIVFMLEVIKDDIPKLFEIEGGPQTVRERILAEINFILLDEIGKIKPVELDEDKGNTIKELAERLKKRVNKFCENNDYPYEIPPTSEVTISDTELNEKYYEVLARREYTRLEQEAKDLEATKLRERISRFGKDSFPDASASEQHEYALIALGIAKKDVQEKKYGVDPTLAGLIKDIASHFKKGE